MLTALELTAPALRHLSAPQCPSLYTLTLCGSEATAAPQLRTLNLMGCKSLPSREVHQVMAHAPQLHSLNVTACHQLGALVVPGVHSRCHPYRCFAGAISPVYHRLPSNAEGVQDRVRVRALCPKIIR